MENQKESDGIATSQKFISLVLVFLLGVVVLYPILSLFAPLSVLQIILYPLWLTIQTLTITVISFTGFDVWIARGIAIAIYSSLSFFFIPIIGGFIGAYKYLFKRERRWLVTLIGCALCILMYVVSKGVNFNPITGEPLKKYYKDSDGRIELFPIEMNYHPIFGDTLKIADKIIILQFEQSKNNRIRLQEQKRSTAIKESESKDVVAPAVSPTTSTKESESKYLVAPAVSPTIEIKDFRPYINSSIKNSSNNIDVSVTIVDENGDISTSASNAIADIYNQTGKKCNTSLLRSSFVHKAEFQELLTGNSDIIDSLKLSSHTDYLALGRIRYSVQQGTLVEGTIICTASITMSILSANDKTLEKSFAFSVTGNGATELQAQEVALQKLINKYYNEYSQL